MDIGSKVNLSGTLIDLTDRGDGVRNATVELAQGSRISVPVYELRPADARPDPDAAVPVEDKMVRGPKAPRKAKE